ncbi:MAG: PD-(D/E)XK nuclease family protein, partial [Hydrogenophaga sp.]|nr:PD-(D/E)XK nuclease family protein [Hydrogenophaga sp.]
LLRWLTDLASALRADGWWDRFQGDAAGQRIVEALRLREGAAHELDALDGDGPAKPESPGSGRRWSPGDFRAWVRETLESGSFQPASDGDPQVVVLPMAQLLGRPFAAVVAPGCDEMNLPSSPEPAGNWSEAQRQLLGLPGREAMAQAALAVWGHLLAQGPLHLLWRTEHQGEGVAPAPWVQRLLGEPGADKAVDPRIVRSQAVTLAQAPMPVAADLLPQALSASAYQDLRDCPYRFFALRQLRLQSADEIEAEPDKRDLGNWLHAVLKAFHEARARGDGQDDRTRLDGLAQTEAVARGLSVEGGEVGEAGAGFLPYMAAWPALRDGYLAWLAAYEAGGPCFERAEVSLTRSIGPWRLIGQLDRIDRQGSPEGPLPLVIDYKTEPRQTTLDRVKQPLEDTQIAFYAALLGEETVRGGYLSITDSRVTQGRDPATRWVEQPELGVAREHLLAGIAQDLGRIAAGHGLPALGEGRVCEFCAARGLCRKDFRT